MTRAEVDALARFGLATDGRPTRSRFELARDARIRRNLAVTGGRPLGIAWSTREGGR